MQRCLGPHRWHWRADASFDIPGIALAEAVSLGLLEDLLRQLVPPTFVTALEGRFNAAGDKLRGLFHNRLAKWIDLVRYVQPGRPFLPPAIPADDRLCSNGLAFAIFDGSKRRAPAKSDDG